jgi:DNA polymerase elongation subunit (family B)
LWGQIQPDIVTGWNIDFFDIPYMVHRMQRLFGEDFPKKLSPWKVIRNRKVFMRDKKHTIYKILGVSVLDYLETYRNYTFVNQESYSLNHIAWVELGAEKLSYAEYDSMAEFYKRDFPKFMEYNVKDVELVQQLDDKLRLLELNASIAYLAKCNYEDVFGQVRTWDCIIYQHLRDQNIVIPQMKHQSKSEQYAGAYVKDPIVGRHDWVVSFDLNSLYPHLIMQYNISPETKVPNNKDHTITPNTILGGKEVPHDAYSVAANGTCYTKDKQGFLPALMEQMYSDRKVAKKKMIACQKQKQVEPNNKELDYEIAKWGTRQMALKIALNSAYGALGNQWFRFFDVDMAEAITLSGQLSIRWIADKLNEFLNTTVGTEGYDYVVASDTDSVYLRLGNLVDKVCGGRSKSEVVEFLDKASEEIIVPFIGKQYDELACKMNAYQNKMVMEREVIADTGVWTAKKRYVLNVHNSEGVQYDEPKLKIMGIETTRSSTPNVVRQELKEAIRIIMQEDESTLHRFVADFEKRFKTLDPEEVAFPRSVRALEKYANTATIYSKGTPIAVKGALIHNNMLKTHKLMNKYQTIKNGEKIKFLYLKSPNPSGDKVISFLNSLPKEFDLTPFVDYNLQFEKAFLDPLKTILDSVGWNHEEVATLEGLFV